MPNVLTNPEASKVAHTDLLNFLRGKDNPFDVFVAARKPESNFARYHVPSVQREISAPLQAVIERFRSISLERESDLPRSGVLVVRGSRGSGKTHMVHALQQSSGEELRCIVVAPSVFEPHRPFVEYLLHQVVRHFQNETVDGAPGTLDHLADALVRQVLVQAFHGMSEIAWLARQVKGSRPMFWRLFFGFGTNEVSDRKRLLIHELTQPENRSVREVCERCEQEPADLLSLALHHVDRYETRHGISGQIRQGLYTQLIRRAFGESREDLYDFLLDGYTRVDPKTQPARETLVDELFRALIELCLLARTPIVFAFDALESLLGDPVEQSKAVPFFRGIADVLDSHRGLPFLIFAETKRWDEAIRFMSDYAKQRFEQGVIRIPNHGSIKNLDLTQVSVEKLADIVAARMQPLLTEYHPGDAIHVPAIFPFTEEELRRIAREPGNEPPLRQALQLLHDRYESLVNGSTGVKTVDESRQEKVPPAEGIFIEQLESCWQRQLRLAKGKLEGGGLAALADELHGGIDSWFKALFAENNLNATGRPTSSSNETVGNHPTYGQVTRYDWSDGKAVRKLGLGLLLGVTSGMARDLETKLKMMKSEPPPFETLVILWPKGADLAAPYQQHFTGNTLDIWKKYEKNGAVRRVLLRAVALESLQPWLALPGWLKVVRTELDKVPAGMLNHFIVEKTAVLLTLVAPEEESTCN